MSYCFCFHQGNRMLLFFIKVQYWDRGCSTVNGVLFLGIIINIFCTLVITDIKWNVQEYILSGQFVSAYQLDTRIYTAHKIKFSVNTFFNKYEQIRNFPWIFTHLLKKNKGFFCAVIPAGDSHISKFFQVFLVWTSGSFKTLFKNFKCRNFKISNVYAETYSERCQRS